MNRVYEGLRKTHEKIDRHNEEKRRLLEEINERFKKLNINLEEPKENKR